MNYAAVSNETLGWTIFLVIAIGVVVYALVNVLRSGKPELGSEIELAANRKPYLPDEELEGRKLDRTLTIALLVLFVIAVGLPLYWILEPGRQAGATQDFRNTFVKRGAAMFAPTGTSLDALGCEGCHGKGGSGGVALYNLQNPDGTVSQVNWKAPALNTVLLRYSREEVTYVLTYGRPFSPMPAWGVAGGGALNDQQIQNLVDYLESIQITPEQAQQQARDELAKMMAEKNPDGTPKWASEGEALFNMGFDDGFAGGAYACGRCHTQKWSYATDYNLIKAQSGCGALGPSLCDGSVRRQFPATPVKVPCTQPDGSVLSAQPPDVESSSSSSSSSSGSDSGSLSSGSGESSASTSSASATSSSSSGSGGTSSGLPSCNNPFQDHIDFVADGSVNGAKYGVHGQGSGKMPGFAQSPAQPATYTAPDGMEINVFYINGGKQRDPGPGMEPIEYIEAIVNYERGL